MKPPFFLKNLPAPLLLLFRPMLFISLGLHIVLLMLPIPSDSKKPKVEPIEAEKESEIKITKLPPKTSPQPTPKASPQTSVQPTPKPSPTPSQPKPTPRQLANQLLPRPKPTPSPTLSPTPEAKSTPTPTPSPTPESSATPSPSPTTESSPSPSPLPSPSPSPTPSPTETPSSTPSQSLEDFIREFPTYQQAQPGSGEILRPEFDKSAYIYNTSDSLEQVANSFESNLLPGKEYNAQLTTEENNFQVFEVSKGKITQYLHLISQGDKVALVLLEKAYSLDSIKTAKTGEVDFNKTAFIIVFSQIEKQYEEGTTTVDRSLLNEGNKFQNSDKFDFRVMTGAPFLNPPTKQELINSLRSLLQQGEVSFNFEEVGDYGGGSLFKVSRETFEIYVIFAPAGDRTAIILAEEDPR